MLPKFLTRRRAIAGLAATAAAVVIYNVLLPGGSRRGAAQAQALYSKPLSPPDGPLRTYHLGHSLVGRDMPAMLAQLADHTYESQLGWGTSLREHWEPDLPINGFDAENDHPRYRDATAAVGSGAYGAVVLTEMVELRDAIRYHDSYKYLAQWARLAHDANPDTRIYLYETWHHTDDPDGWTTRITNDLPRLWRDKILYPALAHSGAPIHLIPGGQVMAAFAAEVDRQGGIGGITSLEDLFATQQDGTPDTIHFNDLGAYLMALTHYAVIYQRAPMGLPFALDRADGSPADAPTPEAGRAMQETVWRIVNTLQETGLAA